MPQDTYIDLTDQYLKQDAPDEYIDLTDQYLGKVAEAPKGSFLNKASSVATGLINFPKRVYEEAVLPVAENLTSQVIGLGDAVVSPAVAARNYLQTLVESGGNLDKALESANKGAKETHELFGAWKPSTELGKSSIEYSNKAVGAVLGPVSDIAKEAIDLPLESWSAPKAVREPVSNIVEAGAQLGAFGAVLKVNPRGMKSAALERFRRKDTVAIPDTKIGQDAVGVDDAIKTAATDVFTEEAQSSILGDLMKRGEEPVVDVIPALEKELTPTTEVPAESIVAKADLPQDATLIKGGISVPPEQINAPAAGLEDITTPVIAA
ncbi:MAG: hypothetical protein WC373_14225, partial [Smithella sp.]